MRSGAGDRAVVDQRQLIGTPMLDMEVDGVVAGVELAAGEPPVERGVGPVQYVLPGPIPLDRLGGAAPESLRRVDRLVAGALIVAGHGRPLIASGCLQLTFLQS